MATTTINGSKQDYTLLEGTAKTYSMATSAVNIYTQKYSGFDANQKVQVK